MINLFSFIIPVAHAVQIATTLPGQYQNTNSGIGGYIANAYQFSLLVGGILAFGVIVYGGIRYMTSVGNPGGQEDAKEWIEGALLGLLLLAGAYFVLKVINPDILVLSLPSTGNITVSGGANTGTGSGGNAFSGTNASAPACGGCSASCQTGTCSNEAQVCDEGQCVNGA
jgi:hypothetical protein